MIARIFTSMAFFSAAKYQIYKGQYLIPVPPKRSMTSYLLFSNDARKALTPKAEGTKVNVAEQSKQIAQKWKNITPEEKAKYQAKADQLRKEYQTQQAKYQAKFVEPFKRLTYNNLFMKQFYQKNKFTNLVEGNEAMKKIKQNMKEQDWVRYKKLAEDQNKENQKIIKNYKIPEKQFKTFNSYLRHLQKEQKAPLKSQMDAVTLQKYEKQYQNYVANLGEQLKKFAKSFHIQVKDLQKMINKEKDPIQIVDQEEEELKKLAKVQITKAQKQYAKTKESLQLTKQKIKQKHKKQQAKQVKKLEKDLQKKKKTKLKLTAKFEGKTNQLKRVKKELITDKAVQKQLQAKEKKTRKSKTQPAATNTEKSAQTKPQTQAKPAAQTSTSAATQTATETKQ